jgi:hypothetical protein
LRFLSVNGTAAILLFNLHPAGALLGLCESAPDRIRTCDLRFRRR